MYVSFTDALVDDIPQDKQFSIKCDFSATLVGWSHSPDGSETTNLLDTSPSKYTVNGNTLTISNINQSDEGLYRCIYEIGHTKELCLFVYGKFLLPMQLLILSILILSIGNAVFASCPLGCSGDPIPLSVASGGNVSFNATVIHTPGGNCGFKQEVSRVILRKIQFETGSSELLLSCATSQTACSRGRVSLNRDGDSRSELSFDFALSNTVHDSDSGLYEVIVEGTHPVTGSLTTITKQFQLEGNSYQISFNSILYIIIMLLIMPTVTAIDCGAPVPSQHGQLGPYNKTLQGSRVTFGCESGWLPIGKYSAICTSEGKWSPDPAQFVCYGEIQ